MEQIMWETVFEKELQNILESYGIDKEDTQQVDLLKEQLNISRRSSCKLLIEVDENWKERIVQIIKNRNVALK